MALANVSPESRVVAYLGPQGTHSEEIALQLYRGKAGRFTPYANIDGAIRAVADGKATECVVPLENSLEGAVNTTLDMLAHEVDLYIVRDLVQPVRHNLLLSPAGRHVNVIVSHAQALAQCRHYLHRHFPRAELQAVDSTAAAAYLVASGAKDHAAIGSRRAAALYGLTVAATDIQDHPGNCTRFVVLRTEPAVPAAGGKTSLLCRIDGTRPGSLCGILQEFAARDVNLTKIESRPARTALGEYIFFLDVDGSLAEEKVRAAVAAVKMKSLWFKNFGSYPVCPTPDGEQY